MKSKIIYFFLLLIILSKGYIFASKYDSDKASKEYTIFIESLKDISEDKVSYYVRIGSNFEDKCILNIYKDKYSNEKYKKDIKEYSNFSYADVIKVKGKFVKVELLNNPGEFNYRLYLYSKSIHGTIYTYTNTDVEYVEYKKSFYDKLLLKVDNLKYNIDKKIKEEMDAKEAAVTKALIYGDMSDVENKEMEAFQNIGVSHLMSVSGSHIASFVLVINWILKRNKEERNILNITKSILLILLVIAYCIFCGFGVSVLRSAIMLITNIVSQMFVTSSKKKDKYLGLKVSFFFILINNPFAIFNTGTQFSYLSVLGILIFKEHILSIIKEKIKFNNLTKFTKSISWVIDGICVSISVQLLILPIQFLSFNKISFPLIISNLIVGALSNVIRIVGSIGVVCIFNNKISSCIFSLLFLVSKITIYIVEALNKISFSLTTKTLPVMFFVLYYLCIIFLYIFIRLKSILKNKPKYPMKYDLYKIKRWIKCIVVVLCTLLLTIFVGINIYASFFSKAVYFFNVKQGDMSYIKYGQEGIVIDVGSLSEGLAFNVLSNFFVSENISKVDLVILSHMHKDHINGLEKLIENYEVKKVIYALPLKETENFKKVKSILKENNIQAQVVEAGHKIYLKNITLEVLLPEQRDMLIEDDENANSLVCKITAGKTTLLYTGDVNLKAEEKLLKKSHNLGEIDILKVAHHGSKTATSEVLLKKIKPKYAVISALKSYYGHPHENTLDTLNKYNVFTFLTQQHGCIKFNLN